MNKKNNSSRDEVLTYANDLAGLLITTGVIIVVNHPIGVIGASVLKRGQDLPSTVGILDILYRGCFKSTTVKYSLAKVAAKENHTSLSEKEGFSSEEQIVTENDKLRIPYLTTLSVVSGAGAEALVLNGFKNKHELHYRGLTEVPLNWRAPYNLYKLNTMCIKGQYVVSFVNIIALCQGEKWVLSKYKFSQNSTLNHFSAGGVCGVSAYAVSFPLEYYRTLRLNDVSIGDEGRLKIPSLRQFIATGLKKRIASSLGNELSQSPIKSIQAAATFGIFAVAHREFAQHPPITSLLEYHASFLKSGTKTTQSGREPSSPPDPGFEPADWTYRNK